MGRFKFWLLAIVILLIFLILIYISFRYDYLINGNITTMLAGLWSAFATGIIGLIALYQNKRYKELSELSTKQYETVQIQIRDLSKRTMESIELLNSIEQAKYYPQIRKESGVCMNVPFKYIVDEYPSSEHVFQMTFLNFMEGVEYMRDHNSILNKNNIVGFSMKNQGEKPIRDFICRNISINSKKIVNYQSFSCDILPGGSAAILLFLSNGKDIDSAYNSSGLSIDFVFSCENLIGDHYEFSSYLFIKIDDEGFMTSFDKIDPPKLVPKDDMEETLYEVSE